MMNSVLGGVEMDEVKGRPFLDYINNIK